MAKTEGEKKFSVTFTMHLTEPLTAKEQRTIVGNLMNHIQAECQDGIEGFAKIYEIEVPGQAADKYAEWDPRIAKRLGTPPRKNP